MQFISTQNSKPSSPDAPSTDSVFPPKTSFTNWINNWRNGPITKNASVTVRTVRQGVPLSRFPWSLICRCKDASSDRRSSSDQLALRLVAPAKELYRSPLP